MDTLKNKVALVTGASSGIGRAITIALAKEGAITYAIARNQKELEKTVELSQYKAIPIIAAMTKEEDIRKVYCEILEENPNIDIWVNNLGQNKVFGNTWEINSNEFIDEFNINFESAIIGTQYALKTMVKNNRGTIINLAGGGVSQLSPFSTSYSCSKTAIVRFVENVAAELDSYNSNVKIYSLNPGLCNTNHTRTLANSQNGKKYYPNLDKLIEDKTVITDLEKIGKLVIDISNNKYNFMHGRLIVVDKDLNNLKSDNIGSKYRLHLN